VHPHRAQVVDQESGRDLDPENTSAGSFVRRGALSVHILAKLTSVVACRAVELAVVEGGMSRSSLELF
jgi:hypothetical protein